MKLFTRARFMAPIGLIAATVGATAVAAQSSTSTSQPSAESRAPTACEGTSSAGTPGTMDRGEARTPFGLVRLVADALTSVCLSDDQRGAVAQLGDDVAPAEQAVAAARHAFVTALAEQLKSGTIDPIALECQIHALVNAHTNSAPVTRKAIEDLHSVLDAEQRAAFVDALETRMNDITAAAGGWFDAFANDLGLSDGQKSRLRAVLATEKPELEMEHKSVTAAYEAFKKDYFLAEDVAPIEDVGSRARGRTLEMVAIAKELTDILTPEQRSALAARIQSTPSETAIPSPTSETQRDVMAGHAGYPGGALGGWGGGYGARGASASYASVRSGYAGGYPLSGYRPDVW